jgi:GNAT superfamily N-acetyltransferase
MAKQHGISPIERGLGAFLRGFSATRSLTHPYPVRQVTPSIWVLSDAPRTRGTCRKSEVIVHGAGAEEAIETIRREAIGRHMLCVLVGSPEGRFSDGSARFERRKGSRRSAPTPGANATRDLYKRLGYRFVQGESLFVLPIDRRIECSTFPVRRVTQRAEAEAIAKAARGRQLLPEHLKEANAPIRLYGAFDLEAPVGWVSSVRADPDCTWVSNLFVRPDYRRRGIGKSLMSAMLNEDASYGVAYSALLASKTGALLYPHLGYEQHGELLLFFPRKESAING